MDGSKYYSKIEMREEIYRELYAATEFVDDIAKAGRLKILSKHVRHHIADAAIKIIDENYVDARYPYVLTCHKCKREKIFDRGVVLTMPTLPMYGWGINIIKGEAFCHSCIPEKPKDLPVPGCEYRDGYYCSLTAYVACKHDISDFENCDNYKKWVVKKG